MLSAVRSAAHGSMQLLRVLYRRSWMGSAAECAEMHPPALLFVGLGNPGLRYQHTRHNVGQLALDAVVAEHSDSFAGFDKSPERAQVSLGHVPLAAPTTSAPARSAPVLSPPVRSVTLALAKPSSYMNLSGRQVAKLAARFGLGPESIVVFHDDLDLEPGRFKLKRGGSSGGHNGIKSCEVCAPPPSTHTVMNRPLRHVCALRPLVRFRTNQTLALLSRNPLCPMCHTPFFLHTSIYYLCATSLYICF